MKKIYGMTAMILAASLVLCGCQAQQPDATQSEASSADTTFEPQHKTEIEKGSVPDGMFPATFERSVTYVQVSAEGDYKEESSEITGWQLTGDTDLKDTVWKIDTDDASSLVPSLGDSYKGKQASLFIHYTDVPDYSKTEIVKGDDGTSAVAIPFATTCEMLFLCDGAKALFDSVKISGVNAYTDGRIEIKADYGQGETQVFVPQGPAQSTIVDFRMALSDTYITKTPFEELPTFKVSSKDLTDGIWDPKITNTKSGENLSPDLSWDKVEGAGQYVVLMIDGGWLHMDVFTTETELAEGAYGRGERGAQYVGPYPPSGTHTYTVFVFALKEEPGKKALLKFDGGNNSLFDIFPALDTDGSGNSGNVLAYARLDGNYTHQD